MKKYPKPFKKHIKGLAAYLKNEFYLREWTLDVAYEREEEEDEKGIAARMSTNLNYFEATLTVYPPVYRMWEKKDWEILLLTIVHEFCHILTDPLYKIAIDSVTNTSHRYLETVREQQTQRIANIIYLRIPKHIYIPKKKHAKKRKKKTS